MSSRAASDSALVLCVGGAAFTERVAASLDGEYETRVSSDRAAVRERLDGADCVVCDHGEHFDGLAVLSTVREHRPEIPVVLCPAEGGESVATEAVRRGVTDYVPREPTDAAANGGTGGGERAGQYAAVPERVAAAVDETDREEWTRAQFEKLVEFATDMLFVVDEVGRFRYLSPSVERILGYEPAAVRGDAIYDYVHPDDEESVRREGERVVADPEHIGSVECRVRRRDGTWRWLEVNARNHLDDPDVEGVVLVGRDVTERRERDRERQRYESVVEAAGDMVYALDPDGRFELVNGTAEPLTGYTPEELVGEHVSVLMAEDDIDAGREIIRDLLEDERASDTLEWTLHTADGETVPCESQITTLYVDGEWRGTVGVVRDVTDRKRREEELERYETLVENAADGVYALDAEGIYTNANSRMAELTGYDREKLIGTDPVEVFGEAVVAEFDDEIAALLADPDRQSFQKEFTFTDADGREIDAEATIAALPYEEEYRGCVGVLRDITDRKRRERALAELHEATRALVTKETREAVMDHAVATVRRVLDMPLNAIHVPGPSGDELVAAAWTAESAEKFGGEPPAIPLEGTLAGESYRLGEARSFGDVHEAGPILNPDTELRSEIHLPLGDHGLLIVGSTTVDDFDATDETLAQVLAANVETALDRVERQRALRRQNERLDEFASLVSHDLRNPLNVAVGGVELLTEEYDDDRLDAVAGALDRMDALIDRTLTLARQGDAVGETGPVALASLVEHCWRTVATGDATLETGDLPVVEADRDRLRHVLENLFRNAVDHGGDDVTITTGPLADGEGFYVADDGPGIPPDERASVFETGYSTADGGTGFGLPIVKRIVEAHGWSIRVTGSETGGARFEIDGVTLAD